MSNTPLSSFFRRWVNRIKSPAARPGGQKARLGVETFEDRLVPATLPTPAVSDTRVVGSEDDSVGTPLRGASPQAAADPNDSRRIVLVSSAGARFSLDGGETWDNFGGATLGAAPSVAFARNGDVYIAGVAGTQLVVTTFDFTGNIPVRIGNPVVVYDGRNQDPPTNPFIAVNNNLGSFTDPDTNDTAVDTMANKAVYVAWAMNATPRSINYASGSHANAIWTAVSGDRGASFSNPVLVSTDPTQGGASPTIVFSPPDNTPDPGPGGATARPYLGGQLQFFWSGVTNPALPAVNIPAGLPGLFQDVSRPDGGNPNQSVVFNQQFSGTGGAITDATVPGSGDDVSQVTTFPITVALGAGFDTLTDLDVDVVIGRFPGNPAAPARVQDLEVTLIAPGNRRIQLFTNRTLSNGNDKTGTPTPGLAAASSTATRTIDATFSHQAHRVINDPAHGTTAYYGFYRPEGGNLSSLNGLTAAELDGVWTLEVRDYRNDRPPTPAPPPQRLESWGLRFNSRVSNTGFGDDENVNALRGTVPFISTMTVNPDGSGTYRPTAAPGVGIPAGQAVAYDATLGSFSRFSGRLYMAYTTPRTDSNGAIMDTDVVLVVSDDNGQTWVNPANPASGSPLRVHDDSADDGRSEGNRVQFSPTVNVDQATGTVVMTWYDARWDASNTRLTRYIATSIDGGATWSTRQEDGGAVSNQTFLNARKEAYDAAKGVTVTRDAAGDVTAVDGQAVLVEPVPDSQQTQTPAAQSFGFRQAVLAYNGTVVPFWAGNRNVTNYTLNPTVYFAGDAATGPYVPTSIYTARVRIAAGPRVVASDMGPVVRPADVATGAGSVTYNNTFAADGTRQLDGFTITFDRPIDVSTLTAADVTARYRAPGTPRTGTPADQTTLIPVLNPVPLDPLVVQFGQPASATRFFVPFATPQSAAGTYSYAVGPDVSDRIRGEQQRTFTPSGPAQTFVATDTPVAIPDLQTVTSQITVPANAFQANELVANVRVNLDITHTFTGDLRLTLIAPDNTRLILSNRRGGGGENYTNTLFDDAAPTPIASGAANPPFTGSFSPEEPFLRLQGRPLPGTWTLEVADLAGVDIGTINSWSLELTPGVTSVFTGPTGNRMDQDADGVAGEANADVYAAPRSRGGVPFELAGGGFDPATLPLVVTGPHVVRTSVPGSAAPVQVTAVTPSATVGGLLVTFDRAVRTSVFTSDLILSVTGPAGAVAGPYTVTPVGARDGFAQQFRIGFPGSTQTPPGTYTVTFTAAGAASLAPAVVQAIAVSPAAAGRLTVTLDRPVTPASLTPAVVTGVTGPAGAVAGPYTVTPVYPAGANPLPGAATRYFEIGFPAGTPVPAGAYTVQIGAGLVAADDTVMNAAAGTLDVTFDRDMDAATFTPADVLRLTGPTGVVPLTAGSVTVTPVAASLNPTTGGYRTFRITFPAQAAPGSYSVELGPDIRSVNRSQLVTLVTAGATTVDVTFDRVIADGGVTAADLLRVTGPAGAVNLAGLAAPTRVGATASTSTFRFTLPAPLAAGQYVLDFAPANNLRVANTGLALDSNFNAGLAVLRGTDPTSQVVVPIAYNSTGTVAIGDKGVAELPVAVADDFIIPAQGGPAAPRVQVLMNVTHPDVTALTVDLVAPDGRAVRLFTGADLINPPPANQRANFVNTTLTDDVNATSILNGRPTFSGTFSPQQPLGTLVGASARGQWRLRVTNTGTDAGSITGWRLTLPAAVPGTGVGEAVADRATAGFRVFNLDPTSVTSRTAWTQVSGPQTNPATPAALPGANPATGNAGRVSAFAVDPSDPSGNTAYAAGAAGGVWKTTNFLTADPAGPVWQPLTDFGPNNSLNVAALAVVPTNNDPAQTVVFALTGEGAGNTPGVGVLRSPDGGRTWQVLDSSTNTDANGNPLPIGSTARNRLFVGAQGYQIVADPVRLPGGGVAVYMAVSGTAAQGGIWRSVDGGNNWTRLQAGNATDVVLAPTSVGANGNRRVLYGAIRGTGVFYTNAAPVATTMTNQTGGQGNGLIRDNTSELAIPVGGPANPFAGAGRIVLAAPAPTGQPLLDSIYQNWLYAYAANPDGTTAGRGLYLTKDAGANWTRVILPAFNPPPVSVVRGQYTATPGAGPTRAGDGGVSLSYPTNNAVSGAEVDPTERDELGQPAGAAESALSIAVDPTNPNVVYVGGLGAGNDVSLPAGGLLRVDATVVNTSQSFVFYDNSGGGVGGAASTSTEQNSGTGGALGVVDPFPGAPTRLQGVLLLPGSRSYSLFGGVTGAYGSPTASDTYFGGAEPLSFLNLSRDPSSPFLASRTLTVDRTVSFTNNGHGAAWRPLTGFITAPDGSPLATDVQRLVTLVDPVTGTPRLVAATQQGLFTVVDDGTGREVAGPSFAAAPASQRNRNGNLQVGQFTDGAVQPSQLAADVAGALFYGMSRNNGFPVSSADVLATGNTAGSSQLFRRPDIDQSRVNPEYRAGTGTGVAVDPSGTGAAFQYRQPAANADGLPLTDFVRYFAPGSNPAGSGEPRVGGQGSQLVRGNGVDDPIQNAGQWPLRNPSVGDMAVNPRRDQNDPTLQGLLLGSAEGRVYLSPDQGRSWTAVGEPGQLDGTIAQALAFGSPDPARPAELNTFLYAGTQGGRVFYTLTGGAPWTNASAGLAGAVQQVVPNPRPGARDAYAVTSTGVYYTPNVTTSAWQNITGNLSALTRQLFGSTTETVAALTPGTLTSLAVDFRQTQPVLYVGGLGGCSGRPTGAAPGPSSRRSPRAGRAPAGTSRPSR